MILKPKLYKTKRSEKLELRLYVAGMRVKSLTKRIPTCFGLINELKRTKTNCRCRCNLRNFCRKVSVQFKGELISRCSNNGDYE